MTSAAANRLVIRVAAAILGAGLGMLAGATIIGLVAVVVGVCLLHLTLEGEAS